MSAPATPAPSFLHAIQRDLSDIAADLTTTAEDLHESNLATSITLLRENYKALGALLTELTGAAP